MRCRIELHLIRGLFITHRIFWKPHKMASLTKREGEQPSCEASRKFCVPWKGPKSNAARFVSPWTEKVRRVLISNLRFSKFRFGCVARLCVRAGGRKGPRKKMRVGEAKKRHTGKQWEKRKKAILLKSAPLDCLKWKEKRKLRRGAQAGKMARGRKMAHTGPWRKMEFFFKFFF